MRRRAPCRARLRRSAGVARSPSRARRCEQDINCGGGGHSTADCAAPLTCRRSGQSSGDHVAEPEHQRCAGVRRVARGCGGPPVSHAHRRAPADANRISIAAAGGIPPLIALLHSPVAGVAEAAVGALRNLSFNGAPACAASRAVVAVRRCRTLTVARPQTRTRYQLRRRGAFHR